MFHDSCAHAGRKPQVSNRVSPFSTLSLLFFFFFHSRSFCVSALCLSLSRSLSVCPTNLFYLLFFLYTVIPQSLHRCLLPYLPPLIFEPSPFVHLACSDRGVCTSVIARIRSGTQDKHLKRANTRLTLCNTPLLGSTDAPDATRQPLRTFVSNKKTPEHLHRASSRRASEQTNMNIQSTQMCSL